MTISTKNIVSITEANQNFSKVARLVDENGAAVILKNNVPRYLVLEFIQAEQEQTTDEESLRAISQRLIAKNGKMKTLSLQQVLALHNDLIREFGGAPEIHDIRLLESALAAPFQTFGGEDLYPSL